MTSTQRTQAAQPDASHLFILSGQSNMQLLDPARSFTPAVEAAFGEDKVIVAHYAEGGEPIAKWYKGGKAYGVEKEEIGIIYDTLMEKVKTVAGSKELSSVTLVWMQGERDSNSLVSNGDVYESYLKGLIQQFKTDLKREDLNVVIGRINDFGTNHPRGLAKYRDWTKVREAQVAVAESDPAYTWVDTDDLNFDGKENGIHMTKEGYDTLGKRFADSAIELIRTHSST